MKKEYKLSKAERSYLADLLRDRVDTVNAANKSRGVMVRYIECLREQHGAPEDYEISADGTEFVPPTEGKPERIIVED